MNITLLPWAIIFSMTRSASALSGTFSATAVCTRPDNFESTYRRPCSCHQFQPISLTGPTIMKPTLSGSLLAKVFAAPQMVHTTAQASIKNNLFISLERYLLYPEPTNRPSQDNHFQGPLRPPVFVFHPYLSWDL